MKIDWAGFATTKGQQVYAGALGMNRMVGINYKSGFLVGWDQWSDGDWSTWDGLSGQLFLPE